MSAGEFCRTRYKVDCEETVSTAIEPCHHDG